MNWSKASQMVFVPLLALAILVAIAGYFMPNIREAIFFKPQRARAEAAVLQLAARESDFHRANGHFETFGAVNGDALHALAVDQKDWPSDNFQFDASATAGSGLRIRALPKAEAVRGLQVGAQMFVTELAARGGTGRSGWYP